MKKNLFLVSFAIFSFGFSPAFAGGKYVPPPVVTIVAVAPVAPAAIQPPTVYAEQVVWGKATEHQPIAAPMPGFPGDGKPASGWYQPPPQDAPIGTPVSQQAAQVVVSQPVYTGSAYYAAPYASVYGGNYGYYPSSYDHNYYPYGGSYRYSYRTAFAERGHGSFRTYDYSPRRASWWGSYGAVGGGFGIGMRVGAPIHHITVRQYNVGVGVGAGVGVTSGLARRGY